MTQVNDKIMYVYDKQQASLEDLRIEQHDGRYIMVKDAVKDTAGIVCNICGKYYDRKHPKHDSCRKDKLVEGAKFDDEKLRLDLLPIVPLQQVAQVLGFGAKKYDDRNWEKGIAWSRLFGAAMRHLFKFWNGQDTDDESGLSHLSHAACCILFLIQYSENRREYDDRPERVKSSYDPNKPF